MAGKSKTAFKIDWYVRLVRKFPLIPIENGKQLNAAIAIIDDLLDKDHTPEEDAYLEVPGQLVVSYEDQTHAIEPATDAQLLADILDSRGLPQMGFAKLTGVAESTVSSVLHGKRKLTREQIAKIAARLDVPAEVFALAG